LRAPIYVLFLMGRVFKPAKRIRWSRSVTKALTAGKPASAPADAVADHLVWIHDLVEALFIDKT